MEKLPKNWVETDLDMLFSLAYGKGLSVKQLIPDGLYNVYGANGIIGNYNSFNQEKSRVIISCRGAASGAIHKTLPQSFVTSNSIVLDAYSDELLIPSYVKYFMTSTDKSKVITGTAQPQITIQLLKNLKFNFPPLAEQQRIVAKLDTLFKHLNSLKQRLEHIPTLLKQFRQSVLTQAVTGKLTEEWREGKELGEWKYEKATECCEKVQSGGTPKGGNFSQSGIPFFKVYNIVNQKISFKYRPQYISKEIQNSQCKKSICYPNDVLMNIVGPPLNKVAIVPENFEECNINQAITLFRVKNHLKSKYLYYFLSEGSSVNSLVNETRGVVGQVNISLTQCREFQIPIPTIKEQTEIVHRVEALFAKADTIEAAYQNLKQQIDNLPQAILAKAFKGELVAQLPTDGDAKDLLKEIAALRASLEKEKKSKKKQKINA